MIVYSDIQDLSESGINLGEMKATDFSNPMYDAISTADLSNGSNNANSKKSLDNNGTNSLQHDTGELFEKGSHPLEENYNKFGSAILSPSSAIHKSSPQIQIRQTTLNPNSVDTDKDTANLVEEDKSEC